MITNLEKIITIVGLIVNLYLLIVIGVATISIVKYLYRRIKYRINDKKQKSYATNCGFAIIHFLIMIVIFNLLLLPEAYNNVILPIIKQPEMSYDLIMNIFKFK